MRKEADSSASNVGDLIEKLTPLKNEFAEALPLRKVEILWQVGDLLVRAGIKSPHSMGWKVQERSYISRDMLAKGYQVRSRWSTLENLHEDLPRLTDYASFRYLFPYIIGTRRPNAVNEAKIFAHLRDTPASKLRSVLRQLKGGSAVPRRRAVSEEEHSVLRVFINFLVAVEQFLFRDDPEEVCGSRRVITDKQIDWFSLACLALAGAVRSTEIGNLDPGDIPSPWKCFADSIPFALAVARGSRFHSSIDRKRFATVASQLQWCKTLDGLKQLRADDRATRASAPKFSQESK